MRARITRGLSIFFSLVILVSVLTFGTARTEAATTVIYLTSGTSWTVPSDWNSSNNTIEVIGGGGGASTNNGAGGGGAYSKISNLTLTAGGSVSYAVGSGGAASTAGGDTYLCNSTSNCASISGTAVQIGAKGGSAGVLFGGTAAGGASASGIGTTKYSGGAGTGNGTSAGGGGGAAGPNGNGAAGGTTTGSNNGGTGGGGADNGSAGAAQAGGNNNGSAGGNNYLSTGGGTGGTSGTPAGGAGTAGAGGGGGYGDASSVGGAGGVGGNGTEWDSTHGAGGGGGGGGWNGNTPNGTAGGNGGTYGGGGGGPTGNKAAGVGGQGIIVITYTPAAAAVSGGGITSNLLQASGSKLTDGSTLTNGLITYWTMNGQDINWTAGKMYDKSTAGNTATLTNLTSASAVTSRIGQAFTFNGTNQYVIGTQTLLVPLVTESIWVKFTSNPGARGRIAGFVGGNGGTDHDKELWLNTNGTVSWYVWDGAAKIVTSSQTITDGKWHNLIGTADGTNSSLYIDGVSVGSVAAGSTYTTYSAPNIEINGFSTGGQTATYVAGAEDDFRVYNRALSTSEIKQLYQLGLGTTPQASSAKLSNGSTLGAGSVNGTSNGLVGYWTMDGQDTNWTAGKTYDKSGNTNTGTLTNLTAAAGTSKGQLGQAFKFNGTSQYVSLANNSSLNLTGPMTVSAWMNPSALPGSGVEEDIVEKGYNGTVEQYVLSLRNDAATGNVPGILFGYYNGTSHVATYTYGSAITTGKWYHLIGVFTGTQYLIYLNGVLVGTTNDSTTPTSSGLAAAIGAFNFNGSYSRYFPGSIDDVRIYNRALSASEIKQLYQQGAGVTTQASTAKLTDGSTVGAGSVRGTSTGLVGHWTMDGQDTNWTAGKTYDKSGNNIAGTLTNLVRSTSAAIGVMGQAMNFNGTSQYINLGTPSALNLTGPFAISLWFKASALPGSNTEEALFSHSFNGTNDQFDFEIQNDSFTGNVPSLLFGTYNGSDISAKYAYGSNIVTGKWYHAVGVFTGTQYLIYVNGVQVASLTNSTAPTSNSLSATIGSFINSGTPSRYFPGSIDDVRVYNRALSATEVLNLYNVGR